MKRVMLTTLVIVLAAAGPNIFPAAQAGFSTMKSMAEFVLLPTVAALIALTIYFRKSQPALHRAVIFGAAAGAVSTLALEAVRLTGFHFDFMPGNLPRLMGVLLLDRFAAGPSMASDIAGWTYHFWNGAVFGIIYALLFGTRRRWMSALYGTALGVGFMLSPVVTSLGVGIFGLQFSYGFPVTVILAHLAFGWSLGMLAQRFIGAESSAVLEAVRTCLVPPRLEAARPPTIQQGNLKERPRPVRPW